MSPHVDWTTNVPDGPTGTPKAGIYLCYVADCVAKKNSKNDDMFAYVLRREGSE